MPSAPREFGAGALALMLDLPACATARGGTGPFVEQNLARLARERGVPVVGLERIEEQVDVVATLPREVEHALLLAVIGQGERSEDVIETSVARWSAGETGALVAWMRSAEPVPGNPASRMPPAFLDRLLDERSRRMAERAAPLIERGGAFVAVGAAHLPGPTGLLSLLAARGFVIERVE